MFQRINIRKTNKIFFIFELLKFLIFFLLYNFYKLIDSIPYEDFIINISNFPNLSKYTPLITIPFLIWFVMGLSFILLFYFYKITYSIESDAIKKDIEFLKKNTIEKYGDYLFLYNEVIYKNRKKLEEEEIEPYVNHNYHK